MIEAVPADAQMALDSPLWQVLWDQLKVLLSEAAKDWRYWFAHVATWLIMAKLKLWWDSLPEKKADRVTESVATVLCSLLSLWVFWGYEFVLQICLMNGLLNTYGYKVAVILLERTGLGVIAKAMKGSRYKVSTKPVLAEAAEYGIPVDEETVFLYRQGDGKTIPVRKSELHKYKVVKE